LNLKGDVEDEDSRIYRGSSLGADAPKVSGKELQQQFYCRSERSINDHHATAGGANRRLYLLQGVQGLWRQHQILRPSVRWRNSLIK